MHAISNIDVIRVKKSGADFFKALCVPDKNSILKLYNYFTTHNFSTRKTSAGILITNFDANNGLKVNHYFRTVDMGTWKILSLNELDSVASDLLKTYPSKRIFAFSGNMGSGKTTFIKSMCKALGIIENVSSPTFALVNEYMLENGNPVYHFDFYRIDKEQEAVEIGLSEYFNSGNYCFIEWSEKILHLLPEDAVRVHITTINETRIITTDNG